MPTIQTSNTAQSKAQEASLSAVVIRCGCSDPQSHYQKVCPDGIREDLGVISYWNRSPLKRFWYWYRTKIMKEIVQ